MAVETKVSRLALRLTPAQKMAISQAADASGQTMSEFSVDTVMRRSEAVLAEQRVYHVRPGMSERFEELLDAPVEPNPGLVRLFSKPSVFIAE